MQEPSGPPDFTFAFRPSFRQRAITGLGGFGAILLCAGGYGVVLSFNAGRTPPNVLAVTMMVVIGTVLLAASIYTSNMLGRSTTDEDVFSARAHCAFYVGAGTVWALASLAAGVAKNQSAGKQMPAVAFCAVSALISVYGAFVWARWLAVLTRRAGARSAPP